MYIIAKEK